MGRVAPPVVEKMLLARVFVSGKSRGATCGARAWRDAGGPRGAIAALFGGGVLLGAFGARSRPVIPPR